MIKTAKRLLLYIGGLLLLAIGVNISKMAQLGISPISSIPYAAELIWGIELGKATMMVYVVLIGLQIVLLKKDFKLIQLLQIVCTYILGFFIKYTSINYLLFWLPIPSAYIIKLIYLFISIFIIAIGVSLYLIADYISLPAEGFIKAIAQVSKGRLEFSNAKILVDFSMVLISATLSLVFLKKLKTVREGTILAAILVGKIIGFIFDKYENGILNWFEKS